jgi:Uma2 family endonuclease
LVAGGPRDYLASHPTRPALVVEVAFTSLALDRGEKASIYARARVTDYWIVNLVDNLLEVYREPQPDPDAPSGWRYASTTTLRRGDAVTPLALPHWSIPVSDLLL